MATDSYQRSQSLYGLQTDPINQVELIDTSERAVSSAEILYVGSPLGAYSRQHLELGGRRQVQVERIVN